MRSDELRIRELAKMILAYGSNPEKLRLLTEEMRLIVARYTAVASATKNVN